MGNVMWGEGTIVIVGRKVLNQEEEDIAEREFKQK